ncbi:hypothetical protein BY458DRAFT_438541 [Sporodiniella umbellata]|nr:hypothetical protein BY458DRAFT_438541 [Sporodiniella umbellata]
MEANYQLNIVQNILPISDFLYDWHVRVGWIAFSTLWVLWGISWFVRNAFGGDNLIAIDSGVVNPESNETTAFNTASHEKKLLPAPVWSVGIYTRLDRSNDVLRDLVLMLLSVLSLNTFARGSTRAVMILAWIFTTFAVIYSLVEASYERRFIRLLYSVNFYGISFAIVGCAGIKAFIKDDAFIALIN